jgi:hypothetical protein
MDGAGRGNRTLVFSLEGCGSTIELYPRPLVVRSLSGRSAFALAGFGMTPRFAPRNVVEGGGFEPPYALAGRFTVCCH